MEDRIRASEQKYRDIYENAIKGIFQTTINGEILSINNSFARVYGYETSTDFMNKVQNISSTYANPGDRQGILKAIDQHRSIKNIHVEVLRCNGEKRWISLNARKVSGSSGDYIEGSVVDITEEILLRKNLEEKERIYRLLAENVSDVIWTADINMKLNYMSPSVYGLLGYSPEEALNWLMREQNICKYGEEL
ncbi:MAG TPA: PAS domain S-box protein [Methanospirillum sp.]|uniref:PAS domain-containing protein n=1 Tax=Methanospirillum sp. TaxID=45200 RepID=UPI002C656553|nr:PAS domain S-box protein [Methanospirillum sp.]HWQ64521.1 PAS domain S-box protein [Methanospirillum sp.]